MEYLGPIFTQFGWTPIGPQAGSAAAGIQSGIGSIATGSLFATLQSAGAGGYGVAAVHGVVQAAGAVVGAGGLGAWFHGQDDGEDDADEDDDSGDDSGDDQGGGEDGVNDGDDSDDDNEDENSDKKKESERDNSAKDEESESTK